MKAKNLRFYKRDCKYLICPDAIDSVRKSAQKALSIQGTQRSQAGR